MYSLARRTLSRNFGFGVRRTDGQPGFSARAWPVGGLPSGGQFALDLSDVAQGAVIGGPGRFGGDIGGSDDVDLVTEMVEGEHAIEEHENAVGNVKIVLGCLADVLQLADDVVGAIADGAGGERAAGLQPGRAGAGEAVP